MSISEQFRSAYHRASLQFRITRYSASEETCYVSSEAGTGSRYAVTVTKLPDDAASREGGRFLISVLAPWQTCYPIAVLDEMHESYILEKLLRPGKDLGDVHGGDAAAIVLTVNEAIRSWKDMTGAMRLMADLNREAAL